MTVLDEAGALQPELVALRRRLHREPEIGLELPRTQEAVIGWLDGLPLEVTAGEGISSVVAIVRGQAGGGGTVLLRGDMDALPLDERSGLDFAATNGRMHACGHDLHTAMLAGAARLLSAQRDNLRGDVVLMFQPGEEGYDGAARMIEQGVLQAAGRTPDAAFALHVTSSMLPSGVVATRPGPLMSAADVLRVTVHGSGGHGSSPHRARDPITAAAEMVTALQTLVTRRFDVFDPVVVTVGAFHAGTQHNIIPESAYFEATVRSFSEGSQARIAEAAVRLCRGIATAHGLDVNPDWETLYPVTVNADSEAAFLAGVASGLFGPERVSTMRDPLTGSEDFSRVLQATPGAMAFLGACPPGADPATAPFNHSDCAVFDEAVLSDGAALYASLAIERLDALANPARPKDEAEALP